MTAGFKRLQRLLPAVYLLAGLVFIGQWIWTEGAPAYRLVFGIVLAVIGGMRLAGNFVKRPQPENVSIVEKTDD